MTQKEALTLMKTGANVFITGPAGSGKTHVVNEYIAYLREHNVPVGITASTGIAATHIGGMTIHSWAGIGVKDVLTEWDLETIAERPQTRRRLQETHVLIIDEVSMLHHFRLDLIDNVLRYARGQIAGKRDLANIPFGGLQVVLCGDFFQLPPVARYGEPPAQFMYHADAWKEGDFKVCYLSENYRQTDDMALSILNEIRSGTVSDEAREHLHGRYRDLAHQASRTDHAGGSDAMSLSPIDPTRLFTHNIDVDKVNDAELAKIPGPEATYGMTSRGRKHLVETLQKTCLAPEHLRLRKGARVMCVKNNFEKGYVNGTLGVVLSCGPGVSPVIRTNRGRTITIESASWTIEDDGRVLAEINQFPLRLAWAITVHKSQGMSLDAIEVDLSQSFEPGMGYVALSRVRTMAGLSILGMNEMALQVHPEVLEHDYHLRELSAESEGMLAAEDTSDIERKQNEFLAKVAPLHRLPREKKISTFEKTAILVRHEESLKEMAKERGMTAETIIDHLERLIEGGKGGSRDGGHNDTGVSNIGLNDIAYLKHEISPQVFGRIEKALEEAYDSGNDLGNKPPPPPLLSPIKAKLGPNVSYKDIRLARVLLGYIRKIH